MTAAASSLRSVRTQLVARPERRPPARGGVPRSRLVAALVGPDPQRLVAIVAPAGFGKTLLLEEWSTRDPRPFAWLTLRPAQDSARALLRAVAQAVDAAHADAADGRIVLVLDDVHVLRDDAARDTLAAIATQLPDNVTVAMASRRELPIPLVDAGDGAGELAGGGALHAQPEAEPRSSRHQRALPAPDESLATAGGLLRRARAR